MSIEEENSNEVVVTSDEAEEPIKIPVVSQLLLVSVVLLLILGGGILQKTSNFFQGDKNIEKPIAAASVIETTNDDSGNKDQIDYFADLKIYADAAFVFDVQQQKVLFQKNPDEQLPLASLTKLMTTLVANEILSEESYVTITQDAYNQDGGSGFSVGEVFSRKDLSDLTLLSSSNDGAYALANAAGLKLTDTEPTKKFVEAMNVRAGELNLTQTYFLNPTGLDISLNSAGAFGSVRDITFLMQYIITNYPELLESTKNVSGKFVSEAGYTHENHNTNQFVNEIPRLIGSKTGYTDLAGGNLAIAFDSSFNHPIIVVVLGSGRSTRFSDVEQLAFAALASVQ